MLCSGAWGRRDPDDEVTLGVYRSRILRPHQLFGGLVKMWADDFFCLTLWTSWFGLFFLTLTAFPPSHPMRSGTNGWSEGVFTLIWIRYWSLMKNKAAKLKSKRKGTENAFGCDLTEHLQNSGQDGKFLFSTLTPPLAIHITGCPFFFQSPSSHNKFTLLRTHTRAAAWASA